MIYLDNAATSWPKPEAVYTAMDHFMRGTAISGGRMAEAERMTQETRTRLARFFNAPAAERVVFTQNATDSLNIALKGLLRPGDHVITSRLEHSSVALPLSGLVKSGVEVTRVTCDSAGVIDLDHLRKAIKRNTVLLAVSHASNVFGTIQPIREIGLVAKEHDLLFLVDAAQTAGRLPIDLQKENIDLLVASGHKGLYGPPGTGILIVRNELLLSPLREGSAGSASEGPLRPPAYTHHLETGTPNTIGIAGLGAGVGFIEETGPDKIRESERAMACLLLAGLESVPNVIIYGSRDSKLRMGAVAFNIVGWKPADLGSALEKLYGIEGRAGLHSAPWAHQALGTYPNGAMRLSPGYFNTPEEIRYAIEAVWRLASRVY